MELIKLKLLVFTGFLGLKLPLCRIFMDNLKSEKIKLDILFSILKESQNHLYIKSAEKSIFLKEEVKPVEIEKNCYCYNYRPILFPWFWMAAIF